MKSISELAKEKNLSNSMVFSRLQKGWSLEDSLKPKGYKRKEDVANKISKLDNELVYLGGYESYKSKILLHCNRCGNTFKRTYERLVKKAYKGKICCPICAKANANKTPISSISYIADNLKQYGYEYISGYKGCESKIKVRCLKCGCIFQYGYHNLITICKGQNKKRNIACPNCYYLSIDHTEAIQKLLKKQNTRLSKQIKKEDEQLRIFAKYLKDNQQHICKCANCSNEFISNKLVKYCSSKCKKRYLQRRKDMLRDKRITSRPHDNITLDKLYKRDNGICYLCGSKCDYKDFKRIDGNIITGNKYPSIEHIKPISKGGTNTWNNVKLAHRYCNSLKGTKNLELYP